MSRNGFKAATPTAREASAGYVHPAAMLEELRGDNDVLVKSMCEAHALCDEKGDLASVSLLENSIVEGEHRIWFLFETTRHDG